MCIRDRLYEGTGVYVTDANGSNAFVTGSNGQAIFQDLPAGDYTITEIQAPAGYSKAAGTTDVTVAAGGAQSVTVEIENSKQYYPLRVIKRENLDGQEGDPLANATFRIQGVDNDVEESVTTNEQGVADIELPMGTYIVTEMKAPQGYQDVYKRQFPGYTPLNEYFGCDTGTGPELTLDFDLKPPYPYEELARDDRTITARNGMGILTQYFVGQEDSMHHFLDHPVKTREDWADMKKRYQPVLEQRLPADWSDELARRLNEATHPVGAGVNGLFWTPRDWAGAEGLMYLFYDDPDMVEDMMDTLCLLYTSRCV